MFKSLNFKITHKKGGENYIKAKNQAEGDEICHRLELLLEKKSIRAFERITFRTLTPDEVLKL